MKQLLNADNLPLVIGSLISVPGFYFFREMVRAIVAWRKGADAKEHGILLDTLEQLARCNEHRDRAYDERDRYRRQVGRRDHIILSAGLPLPVEGDDR